MTEKRRVIAEAKTKRVKSHGCNKYGYTHKSGAPTSIMIRFADETIWRRLMVWQFSNVGTLFVRMKGKEYIIREHEVPKIKG